MQQNPHSLTKVLFVGSFDPFHEGHQSIVSRALSLFDEVVVAVAVNPQKNCLYSTDERVERIRAAFQSNPRVTVDAFSGLTIDYCRSHGISHIIKGVRNAEDFEYEKRQAEWNKLNGQVETILLFAEPGLENVSSTAIRENMK
jgi:pantetheine-phosphate adenylyltransferase